MTASHGRRTSRRRIGAWSRGCSAGADSAAHADDGHRALGVTVPAAPARLIRELAAGLGDALGSDLVGLYLCGSSVTGGFEPGASDLDLVAVTGRPLADVDLGALERAHDDLVQRHPDWRDRIEIVCVWRETLASVRDGGPLAVVSPGEPFHVTEAAEQCLQNWYLVRETGVALVGPSPDRLIEPIDAGAFLAAVARYAGEVATRPLARATPGDVAYAVLTMCRAHRTLTTGAPCSKPEGAAWAQRRFPESAGLIERALVCRRSRGVVGFEDAVERQAAESFLRVAREQLPAPGE